MPVDVGGRRLPCVVCGERLWFHEREQRLCRPCAELAELAGVRRICDARGLWWDRAEPDDDERLKEIVAEIMAEETVVDAVVDVPPRHAMSLNVARAKEAWRKPSHWSSCSVWNGGACTCGGC